MSKFSVRGAIAVLAFLSLCFPVAAQEAPATPSGLVMCDPQVFSTMDSAALLEDLPMMSLLGGEMLPGATELGRMGMAPFNMASSKSLSLATIEKITRATRRDDDEKDFRADPKDLSSRIGNGSSDPLYYSGEIGVFYGHASDKFGGDGFGSYFLSDVGNDKFQITVGSFYQEWNGRAPRLRVR